MERRNLKAQSKHGNVGAATSNESESPPREHSFRCKYCGRDFTCSNTLQQHENVHEREMEAERMSLSSMVSDDSRNQAHGVGYGGIRIGLYQILNPPRPTNNTLIAQGSSTTSHQHQSLVSSSVTQLEAWSSRSLTHLSHPTNQGTTIKREVLPQSSMDHIIRPSFRWLNELWLSCGLPSLDPSQFPTLRAQGSTASQQNQPLVSSSVTELGASSSRSQPHLSHPTNQAFGVGGTTLTMTLMPYAPFQTAMAQGSLTSSIPRPQNKTRGRPRSTNANKRKFVQESGNSSTIPQNVMPQGSGSSYQHHTSFQPWFSFSAPSSGSQPDSSHPSLCYEGIVGQENSNSSTIPPYEIRERTPDLNVNRPNPLCDERKFGQANQSAITVKVPDLNVTPLYDDENSDQQNSSSTSDVDLTLRLSSPKSD